MKYVKRAKGESYVAKKALPALVLLAAMLVMLLSGCAGEEAAQPPAEDEPMAGAYSAERELTEDDLAVFNDAEGDHDIYYVPRTVATQVVAGINYRFGCVMAHSEDDPDAPITYVFIYQPLEGPAEFVRVSEDINGND